MPNKEERILITKVSLHCHALRIMCDPFDNENGIFCDKSGQYVRITEKDCIKCKSPVLAGISRAEAVEGKAKAIRKVITIISPEACQEGAEAALDARLGDNNA